MIEYDFEIPMHLGESDNFNLNLGLILDFIKGALLLWNTLNEANLNLTRLAAAMTNNVFIISHDDPNELPTNMLLRVYGAGTDFILDRKDEIDWFSKLSELGVGPRLYAAFKNGRFEEYVESQTLTPPMMRDPFISQSIATSLARFHATVNLDSSESHDQPLLWSRLELWRKRSIAAFEVLQAKNPSSLSLQRIQELGVMSEDFALESLVNWRNHLSAFESPIVFSHNDLQHGNILLAASGKIVLIDYEYGGLNYAAFDIANHFCEWASDFTDQNPHPEAMDFAGKYPTERERRHFMEAYLSEFYSIPPSIESVDSWLTAVEHFKFISNIIWGYWGVIQAAHRDIGFDYLKYSLGRFEEALADE
jgi:choline/ethanolamine kinase